MNTVNWALVALSGLCKEIAGNNEREGWLGKSSLQELSERSKDGSEACGEEDHLTMFVWCSPTSYIPYKSPSTTMPEGYRTDARNRQTRSDQAIRKAPAIVLYHV